MSDRVVLEAFGEQHIRLLEPWFEDPGTQQWLGGPGWPRIALDLQTDAVATEDFRGSRVLRSYGLVGRIGSRVVSFIGGDVYDREHRVAGRDRAGELEFWTPQIASTTSAIAFVVDPALRGAGLGRATLEAVMGHPDLADVQVWVAGVEPGNHASRALLASCGFVLLTDEPDAEDMLTYRRAASGRCP